VYADDHQVGEITLTDSIGLKTRSLEAEPFPLHVEPPNYTRVYIIPEKLFLFEIQEQHLNDRITIKVENDFNNHTNGFMTKFSYINFRQIFLVPDCLLQLKTWQMLKERNRAVEAKEMLEHPEFQWWTSGKPWVFKETKTWPMEKPGNYKLKNYQRENSVDAVKENVNPHTQQLPHSSLFYFDLGGSFMVDLPVSRKHQMFHLGVPPMGRPNICMQVFRTLWTFNQLNTNT
jgi:hypothetical protein